jgi:hypothetical protein
MPANASDDRAPVCAFVYSDGRTCRMLPASSKSQFCFYHERKLRNVREADYTAAEICEPLSHDFVPATALTQSLTRAFRAVAEGRIDAKSASALARLASTLLKSIDKSSAEFQECYKDEFWRQLIWSHHRDLPALESPSHDGEPDTTETNDAPQAAQAAAAPANLKN